MAIKTETSDYKQWKKLHGFKEADKDQFATVKRIREAFEDAKNGRGSNCYWTMADDGDEGTWEDRWERQEKQWLRWYKTPSSDNFKSNVKSPATTGRVESTNHKLLKLNLRWSAIPTEEEDTLQAKIASKVLDYVFYDEDMDDALNTWMKDALIHGTSIARIYYTKQDRSYRFPKTASEIKDKKEKELVKEGKIVLGKKEKKTKYEGIVLEPVPLQEFYPDPQARLLHGRFYEARYIIRRRLISLDDFYTEYENDPNAMNVKKVEGAAFYEDDSSFSFFRPPEDIDGDTVELLEYEDQLNDEYMVVANDVLVKEGVLPFSHKEITYCKLDAIKNPHQFYHIGIPDLLDNDQAAEEILMNMLYDYIYRSYNMQYFIANDVYGQTTDALLRQDSQYIPMDTKPGEAIQSKYAQLQPAPIGFDAFRLLDMTTKNQTLATQIDPTQMALNMQGRTATATLSNRELADALVNSLAENFSIGLAHAGKQIWSIVQQKFSTTKVKEITGEGKNNIVKKYKKIRLEGIKLVEKDGDIVTEQLTNSNDYSFFELKDKYLKTTGDLDIRIAADSLKIISESFDKQNIKEMFAQLMPYAANPNEPEKIKMNPNAYLDGNKLMKHYLEKMGAPLDLQLDTDADDRKELEQAMQEVQRMLKGEVVEGIPGRSSIHRLYESDMLRKINEMVEDLKEQINELITKEPPQYDPMTQQPQINIPPEIEEKFEKYSKIQKNLADHLATDNEPGYLTEESILARVAPPPEPQAPAQPPMPGGDMGMGGGMGQAPGGQMAGQPPMPQGPTMQGAMPGFGGMD